MRKFYSTQPPSTFSQLLIITIIHQIANVCITLNEYPYIRYYLPKNHLPLGALKPSASIRPPPPPESSARWRTNLARGGEARAYEAVEGDHATKLLAFFVQQALDEKKTGDPDWPVNKFSLFTVCIMLRILCLETVRSCASEGNTPHHGSINGHACSLHS